MAALGRGEEGENKISPPSPGQNRTEAVENLTEGGENKTQRKKFFSQEREESFSGRLTIF
jgi:hypothetical protein